MKSTSGTVKEAKCALTQYMESERRRQHGQCVTFDAGASFHGEDEAQHGPESPERVRAQAQEYANARNQNLRPPRQIDEADENARDGRDSALAFLEKRSRSVIRK